MRYKNLLLTFMTILLSASMGRAAAPKLDHMHPLNWWSGMQHNRIQVMMHGKDIGDCDVSLENAQDVQIVSIERVENPNYLFIYLDLQKAQPQIFKFCLTKPNRKKAYLMQPFEIQERSGEKVETFGPQDVVYLLMPDRFINGNQTLDNVPGMVEPQVDYLDPQDFGRHGGDLAGISQALDYLQELGITAIWPTPVQTNDCTCSYHGYAISDYYHIDPRFGTNEEYLQLVEDCHKHGLKMIMDMVFNHCGAANFLFTDLPQKDWFSYHTEFHESVHRTASIGDPHASDWDRKHTVDGWFVKQMPDWNQRNPLVKDYLIQCSIWWVEYAHLNGYRQDTYPYCDKYMMRDWCVALDKEYPGFNITGETWINSGPGIAYWQKDSKLSDFNSELKTIMDFPLMNLMKEALDEETNDYNSGLMKLYYYIAGDRIYANPLYLLTFLDNHDTDRFQTTEQESNNINRYKQALLLITTLRGIPQLYYGDELGMFASKKDGDGWLRQDFPVPALEAAGRSSLQKEYFDYAKRLLNWRKGCKAVQWGELKHFACQKGCYVYSRSLGNQRVTVFMNGTNEAQTLTLERYAEVLPAFRGKDILTDKLIDLSGTLTLQPRQSVVIDF
ncbi:MAG: cyclomaltodextrinase N-terminal domain-containing protein [Bacteroidales bacterium]|nr:cyclomaltodextrinase N-terminal domain-containing protein [Bacteroidales bacterium]